MLINLLCADAQGSDNEVEVVSKPKRRKGKDTSTGESILIFFCDHIF